MLPLTVRVDEHLHKRICADADELGVSMASIVRSILFKFYVQRDLFFQDDV